MPDNINSYDPLVRNNIYKPAVDMERIVRVTAMSAYHEHEVVEYHYRLMVCRIGSMDARSV